MSLKHIVNLPHIDYIKELKGNPLRIRTVDGIKNIVIGNMRTALYYARWGDYYAGGGFRKASKQNFQDAYTTLGDSNKRIDLFLNDAKSEGIEFNSLLINNLRVGISGIREVVKSFERKYFEQENDLTEKEILTLTCLSEAIGVG